MNDEYIRLDTTIIAIDNLINEAATGTMARTLFKAKDTIYNQQRYVIDVQPVNQWISVEDKLPIEQGPVLCYAHSTTGEGICLGTLRNGEFWLLQVDGKQFSFPYLHLKVSHWMPLPEPPKDGERKCQ